jgi:hypothetical protein
MSTESDLTSTELGLISSQVSPDVAGMVRTEGPRQSAQQKEANHAVAESLFSSPDETASNSTPQTPDSRPQTVTVTP